MNKLNRVIHDSSNTRISEKYIFCRQVKNGDTCQVKTCSISWNILPTFTPHLFVLEWPELGLILSLLTLRFAMSSGFAQLVSRVFRSLLIFPAVLVLSLHRAAVSFLPFLRLLPSGSSFSLFLCWYKHLLFLDCISILSLRVFSCEEIRTRSFDPRWYSCLL